MLASLFFSASALLATSAVNGMRGLTTEDKDSKAASSRKIAVSGMLLYFGKSVKDKAEFILRDMELDPDRAYKFYMYVWALLYASYGILPFCQ